MARAEGLLEGVPECAAHGWLVLDRAPWTSDASEREQLAVAAIEIARRYGDRDLEFDAIALLGDAYVARGRVTEGMTLLDQVMAAVAAGEVVGVGPAGEIYCRLLSACERATDVDAPRSGSRPRPASRRGATSCRRPAGLTTGES